MTLDEALVGIAGCLCGVVLTFLLCCPTEESLFRVAKLADTPWLYAATSRSFLPRDYTFHCSDSQREFDFGAGYDREKVGAIRMDGYTCTFKWKVGWNRLWR